MEATFSSRSAQSVGDAKGVAKAVLEAAPTIETHLRATPHFGILQELVPMHVSRFDYVALQISSALKLKQSIPGLGLSSPVQLGKERISGLELLQLWALLISAGHLFGTFATERALSYRLQAEPKALDEFLRTLPPDLAVTARTKVTTGGMNEFVNVLALWRLVHENLPKELRKTCVEAIAMYLRASTDPKERRLYALHRRIRQAAYQRLQGACSVPSRKSEFAQVGFVSIGASAEDFFDRDAIGFDPLVDQATPMFHLMQAVDEFQFRSFFTSQEANRLVLDHLRQFKVWWRNNEQQGHSVEDRVHALRARPADWPSKEESGVGERILRLDLRRTEAWFPSVRAWLGTRVWESSNFLLTEVAGASANVCDVFSPSLLSVRECEHVGRMLCASDCDAEPAIARSIARFGILLLSYCLNDKVRPQLEPMPAGDGHGLAAISGSFAHLVGRVDAYAKSCDEERGRELAASLQSLIEKRPPDGGVWLAFLGRLVLCRADEDAETMVQEFDGLFLRVTPDAETWFAFEHKVTGQGGAGRQLARLKNHLTVAVQDEGTGQSSGSIAWLIFGRR
jgi:hypothetical protein